MAKECPACPAGKICRHHRRVVIIARGQVDRYVKILLASTSKGWEKGESIEVPAKSSMPDTLVVNNKTYVLDSTLLESNTSDGLSGHAIAGVSCNNSKFYYNGWSRGTGKSMAEASRPCPLIDVDWTKRGIFLASSLGTETLRSDYCHMNVRKHPTDLSFDGTSETQDQLMFYVLQE